MLSPPTPPPESPLEFAHRFQDRSRSLAINQNLLVTPSLLESYAGKTMLTPPNIDRDVAEALRITGAPLTSSLPDTTQPHVSVALDPLPKSQGTLVTITPPFKPTSVLQKLKALHAHVAPEPPIVPETRFRLATDVRPHRQGLENIEKTEVGTKSVEVEIEESILAVGTESGSAHYTDTEMEDYVDQEDLMDTVEAKKYRIRKQELRTPSPKSEVVKSPTRTLKKKK